MEAVSPDFFQRAIKELGPHLDNRRTQMLNALRWALENSGQIHIVAVGNIISHVAEIELAGGRIYRPWPGPFNFQGDRPFTRQELIQQRRGEYVLVSTLDLEPFRHLSPASKALELERVIAVDTSVISLGAGGSLRWHIESLPLEADHPDTPVQMSDLRGPSVPGISSVINGETAAWILELSKRVTALDVSVSQPLLGAMQWFQVAEEADSVLVAFLCHWVAIERHASWWFEYLGKSVDDDDYLNSLRTLPGLTIAEQTSTITIEAANLGQLVSRLSKIADRRSFSARAKIEAAFDHVFGVGAGEFKDVLFAKRTYGKRSRKDLRDDIAHGNIDEVTVADRRQVEAARYAIAGLSRKFLYKSMVKVALVTS